MDKAPTTEAVYQSLHTFYNNSNAVEQEKASKWLEQFQSSVSDIKECQIIRIQVIMLCAFQYS